MPYKDPAERIREQIEKYSRNYSRDYSSRYASRYGSDEREPTQAELETYQYVLEEQKKRDKKKRLLQPVEAILDLLSRGQYVTANMVQNAVDVGQGERDKLELGKAAWEGLTGKRKGDYTDILEDIGWEPETKAGKFARGAVGFLGNVFLDPTTYIGFGPAKAARTAASTYADDMTRIMMKHIGQNVEQLPGAVLQKLNKETVKKLAEESPEQLAKYLSKHGGDDFARYMNDTYKELYRRGLRTPGEKLSAEMDVLARQVRGDFAKADDVAKVGDDATRVVGQLEDANKYLPEGKGLQVGIRDARYVDPEDIGKTVTPDGKIMTEKERFLSFLDKIIEEAPERYSGAGMRSVRYLGKELHATTRNPLPLQAIDKARDAFKKSKVGGVYSDAVWSMLDRPGSVVGKLKRAFNIRNPYQQALEAVAADIREEVPVAVKNYADEIHKVLDPLSPDEKKLVRDKMIARQSGMREDVVEQATTKDVVKAFRDGRYVDPSPKITEADKKIEDAVNKINDLTGRWKSDLDKYAQEGLIKSVGDIENYLPIQEAGSDFYKKVGTIRGHMGPSFTRERSMDWPEHVKRQVEKLKWIWGVSDETAIKMVNEGFSDLNMDLEKMLVARAMGQAKVEARVNMLRHFRGFGIHLDDMSLEGTDLIKALSREGTAIQQLGLRTIDDPALKGYLFDNDVARVLERALTVTQHDESIKGIAGWIRSFNNMWKGWATLSPGFHMRNELSNNITGFLNHGVGWFNPKNGMESVIATAVGLHGEEEAIKRLSKTIGARKVKQVLARRYGGRTLREITDYATKKGIITRATMAFDLPSSIDDFLKPKFNARQLNPLSADFKGIDISRQAGSFVESQSKMHNFLLDYKDIIKHNTSEGALDWAKNNTKKWFLDYADLSQFEQKVMKSVIPFYTWLRKNTANQIRGLVELTPMYSTLAKELDLMYNKEGVDKEALPDYMRELGYMPSFKVDDDKWAMFWPNIPLYDLNKIPFKFEFNEAGIPIPVAQGPGEVVKEIAASANPMLKTIVEVVPKEGWHTFYQTPLGTRRRAPGLTQVFKEDSRVIQFLDGLMQSVGIEEGLNPTTDENGNLMIDAKTAQILENNFLQLKRIPEFLDAPELLVEVLKDYDKETATEEDKFELLEDFFKVLSFNMGIKFKAFDEEQFRRMEAEDILKAAEEARAEDRRQLPQAQQRRTQYINNRLAKQRRMGLL